MPLDMQIGFWGTVACFPLGYGLYQISRQDPDSPSLITRIIKKYEESHEALVATNAVHTAIMEQAGADRVLFMNSKPQEFVDMKFPEYVNPSSTSIDPRENEY